MFGRKSIILILLIHRKVPNYLNYDYLRKCNKVFFRIEVMRYQKQILNVFKFPLCVNECFVFIR